MSLLSHSFCGDGDPVLFVHGWGVHSGVWTSQVEELSDNFKVVTIDLPGHGRSAPEREPLTLELSAQRIVETVNGLSLGEVHLVGWSLGAQIVCLAAKMLGSRRVRSLTFVGGTPCFVAPKEGDDWAIPKTKATWFQRSLETDFRRTLEEFILSFFNTESISDSALEEKVKALFFDDLFPPDEVSAKELLNDFIASDIRERLDGLDMPCLICHGELDRIVPTGVSNIWERLLPSTRTVIIKNCGHAPFLTKAAEFNESLKNFLISSQR